MKKRKLMVIGLAGVSLALSGGPAFGFAQEGSGNSGSAPGQGKAVRNCIENILKQNANGQTGSQTGSSNDEKQLGTAVTNCDHFWDLEGSNP